MTRVGTIVLAGLPNVGKSTLFNALVGEPLAIVSSRPQSTRLPVTGIRTDGEVQLLFVDPPGLLEPRYLLQQEMTRAALEALRAADGVLHLHRAAAAPAPPLESLLSVYPDPPRLPRRRLVVLTQVDRLRRRDRPAGSETIVPASARTGEGLDRILAWCRSVAAEGPFRYDPDSTSTQPVRFFAEEYVREAAFQVLRDELPYALAAEVDEFRETSDPVYIRVVLHIERESQRAIVLGRGGQTIRALGTAARERISALLGRPVYLDLWVKVLPKWRSSPHSLRRLGFPVKDQT